MGAEGLSGTAGGSSGFALDDLSFNPGFGVGCADSSNIRGGSFGGATLQQPVQLVSGRQDQGRYVQFSVSGSEIYTDNINHTHNGDWDLITQITPRVAACSDTGRIKVNFDYALEGVVYAHNTNYSDVYNNVDLGSTITVIPNHLFLDLNTTYGQAVIDPSIDYSTSNSLNPKSNKTGAWTSNISPFLVQTLGPVGTASLRGRYGYSLYGNNNVPASSVIGAYFNLSSPRQQTVTYTLSASSQKVDRHGGNPQRYFQRRVAVGDLPNQDLGAFPFADYQNTRQNSNTNWFDRATLRLGYRLTNSLQLIAQGGLEDDYRPDGTNNRLSRPSYEGGFRWSGASNTLEATVGHRFYGTTYSLSASHQSRLFRVDVDYTEQPTSQGLNSLNGGSFGNGFGGAGGYGGGGGFGGGFGGAGDLNNPTTSLFDRGVFIEKRWSGALSFQSALTQTVINAYRQKRDYRNPAAQDDVYTGVGLSTQYQVQPRTTIVPEARWSHRQGGGRGLGGNYDTYEVGITGLRTILPSLQAGLGYLHGWRNGDNSRANYQENRITLQVLKNF